MRVQRHSGESAETSRKHPQPGRNYRLPESVTFQTLEYPPFGRYVEDFDQCHHDDDQEADVYAFLECGKKHMSQPGGLSQRLVMYM